MSARTRISRRPIRRVKRLVSRARLGRPGARSACYRAPVRSLPLTRLVVLCAIGLCVLLAAPRGAVAEVVVEPPTSLAQPCQGITPAGVRVCSGLDAAGRGHWAEAEALLESALVLEDPMLALHADEIASALAEARLHLGSLEVHCAPPGATIAIDGLERGLDPLDRPLRMTIGAHVVRCTAPDHEAAEQTVDVAAGALASLTLTLTPIDRRPILERVGSPGESQRIVGIVSLSLGGVSVAIGLGTLFAGLGATGSEREPYFDVARGTLIAGGVLVVAGLVLVLTAE